MKPNSTEYPCRGIWHAMPEELRARANALPRGAKATPETNHNTVPAVPTGATLTAALPTQPFCAEPQTGATKPKPGPWPEEGKRPEGTEHQRKGKHASVSERDGSMASRNALKTKHTVHFRGRGWENLLNEKRSELAQSFTQDVVEATGLDARQVENLTFEFAGMLLVKFVLAPKNVQEHMSDLHGMLQSCKFPHIIALYKP
ncbi:putative mitotubule-associated protein Gb4 [Trypanosoma rangeli]|uniref:Putative mitotubule-associated protein Gb4 n=1 Tax=Trypanosoma rangeli TaxID=5698 RepID=A0A3R7KEM3_TRYRA|nr:putative mitotubule-associated protein Gb4 [Trypanosoma rangeli]RNE98939.1 putative mitotubule-associated protein Gb4 [Trypanosoma rangeli]|eukprot:RNE98939.1 putative mitotubule-associated protein Gb4 [Trypanosoma rangeli]